MDKLEESEAGTNRAKNTKNRYCLYCLKKYTEICRFPTAFNCGHHICRICYETNNNFKENIKNTKRRSQFEEKLFLCKECHETRMCYGNKDQAFTSALKAIKCLEEDPPDAKRSVAQHKESTPVQPGITYNSKREQKQEQQQRQRSNRTNAPNPFSLSMDQIIDLLHKDVLDKTFLRSNYIMEIAPNRLRCKVCNTCFSNFDQQIRLHVSGDTHNEKRLVQDYKEGIKHGKADLLAFEQIRLNTEIPSSSTATSNDQEPSKDTIREFEYQCESSEWANNQPSQTLGNEDDEINQILIKNYEELITQLKERQHAINIDDNKPDCETHCLSPSSITVQQENLLNWSIRDKHTRIIDRIFGTVAWFSKEKGYGVIICEDNNQEVFVHRSVQNSFFHQTDAELLKKNDTVTLQIIKDQRGQSSAKHVLILSQAEIDEKGHNRRILPKNRSIFNIYAAPSATKLEGLIGTIVLINYEKYYAFAKWEKYEQRIHISKSQLRNVPKRLFVNDIIQFDVEDTGEKIEATNIQLISGYFEEQSMNNKQSEETSNLNQEEFNNKIISERVTGTIKFFDVNKGFGKIIIDNKEEFYVNKASINNLQNKNLQKGDKVIFDVIDVGQFNHSNGYNNIATNVSQIIPNEMHSSEFDDENVQIDPSFGGENLSSIRYEGTIIEFWFTQKYGYIACEEENDKYFVFMEKAEVTNSNSITIGKKVIFGIKTHSANKSPINVNNWKEACNIEVIEENMEEEQED